MLQYTPHNIILPIAIGWQPIASPAQRTLTARQCHNSMGYISLYEFPSRFTLAHSSACNGVLPGLR